MQIVINISENDYETIKRGGMADVFENIADGIVLPQSHGRLGDLDELIYRMKERNDDNGGEPLNMCDRGYDLAYRHMLKEIEDLSLKVPASEKDK